MSKRYTGQRLDWDYDADRDWGSHQAANTRERAQGPEVSELDRRLNPAHPYGMVSSPLPCRLCEPGYVCAFHRDDDSALA